MGRDWAVGDVKKQTLGEILAGKPLADLWTINMDSIEVCRDCEYRYACNDCRVTACQGDPGHLHAANPGCAYDPYTGTWRDSEQEQRWEEIREESLNSQRKEVSSYVGAH
jgi:radical SAM protein with 4Fe4S-binding SPASM domain